MSSTPTVPTLKKMAEILLDENAKFGNIECRNSDIALTILIWRRWYNVKDTIEVGRLFHLPREDNVKRVRAVFQNTEHKYLPTDPSILIKRGIEEAYWFDALGYNLTPDEWRIHRQTAKETIPPASRDAAPAIKAAQEFVEAAAPAPMTETDMLVAGHSEFKPVVLHPNEPTPMTYTTKLKAIYLPKTYSGAGLQTGQEYDIEIERLATGHPIKMIVPVEAQYLNLQAFAKTWKVLQ